MSKPEKREFNVTVLSRREISVFPKIGVEEKQFLITYVAAGLPPHTLTIKKVEWTESKEKALLRKDIEERLKEKPETFTV